MVDVLGNGKFAKLDMHNFLPYLDICSVAVLILNTRYQHNAHDCERLTAQTLDMQCICEQYFHRLF